MPAKTTAKPVVETPETPAETPEAEKPETPEDSIVAFTDLTTADATSDDSIVGDVKLAASAFDSYMDAGARWIPLDAGATAALEDGAKASMDLSASILLADGITPDWAGNSDAYSKAFQKRTAAYLAEHDVDKDRFEKFRGSVRVWISRNNYADKYIARWTVAHHPTLGATPVGKKVKDGQKQPTVADVVNAAVKDSVIPQPVRAEMQKQFNQQRTKPSEGKPNGTVLPAFRNGPATRFGNKRPSSTSRTGAAGNTGPLTPSKLWGRLREEVPTLAALALAQELAHLTTVSGDALLGQPGQKPTSRAVDKDGAIAERDAVVEMFRNLSSLAQRIADNMEGVDGASKDDLATYRYTPEK